jgi:hypothetical protein
MHRVMHQWTARVTGSDHSQQTGVAARQSQRKVRYTGHNKKGSCVSTVITTPIPPWQP